MFERLTEVKRLSGKIDGKALPPSAGRVARGLQSGFASGPNRLHPSAPDSRLVGADRESVGSGRKAAALGRPGSASFVRLLAEHPADQRKRSMLAIFLPYIQKTTFSYAPGLFHSYDIPGLPRTNNQCESTFRDLNRRLLRTTGQKGLTRRIIQRTGAWELLPCPDSLQATLQTLKHISPQDFQEERLRFRQHRDRFRLHTRSVKQSHAQLNRLEQRWANLPAKSP